MPRWFHRVRVAVRSLLRRKRVDAELHEEMQEHLEHEIEERMRAGMSRDDARRAARLAMGAIEKSKEESRDLWAWPGVSAFLQDVRFGLRLFRKHPGPIAIAIGGLALAIAVVTSVFSIVNATMLRPYGMDDPKSVAYVALPGAPAWLGLSYASFVRMKEGTTLAELEAAVPERGRFSTSRADDGMANREISFVSGGYLRMLGGRAAIGRTLEPADDKPYAPPVVVVSHRFWQSVLNSDRGAIGRTVWINEAPVTLVGVLAKEFTGPEDSPRAIWAPLSVYDDLRMGPPISLAAAPRVVVVARLAPGVGRPALQQKLSVIELAAGSPASSHDRQAPRKGVDVFSAASPLDTERGGDTWMALMMVLGVVGLVLALACANTSNLLRAAAVTRMREVGIRLAMGASKARLVQQLIHESLLLGLIAGGLGFIASFWVVTLCGAAAAIPPETNLAPDWRVLLFTVAVALACGLGAGLSPARYGARGNVLVALQSQAGSRGSASLSSRFRMSFIGFQSAASILLLVMAALLARSAMRMTAVDVGFDADHLVGVTFSAPRKDFDAPAYIRRAIAAVRDVPAVQSASVVQLQPHGCCREPIRFTHDGSTYQVNVNRSDVEFFVTAGVPVLRGRMFTRDEVAGGAPVALVSEDAARAWFGDADPLGRPLPDEVVAQGIRQESATIIGVTSEALLHRIDSERFGAIYRPISEKRDTTPTLLVRASNPAVAARAVETALRGVDARVQVNTGIIGERIDSWLQSRRRIALGIVPVAALAVLLSALGVFGMTSFVVSRRMEEMSVRMAIGASGADVFRLLVKESLRPVAIGLAIGLVAAIGAAQVVASELAGISAHDPVSIGVSVAVLVACAFLAVIVPAYRATTANPAWLLRQA
jgi:predicted permease